MFKIAQSPDYFWPVAFTYPGENGKVEKANFDARFKRISQSRIAEIQNQIKEGSFDEGSILKEIVVGWRGVVDDAGEEIPFSITALDKLLDVPMLGTHIAEAFMASLSGAQRKN